MMMKDPPQTPQWPHGGHVEIGALLPPLIKYPVDCIHAANLTESVLTSRLEILS